MYRKTVKAPSSIAEAPTQVRWSVTREISEAMTRMYWPRSGTVMPASFSAVIA
jgi:hypothetical protein